MVESKQYNLIDVTFRNKNTHVLWQCNKNDTVIAAFDDMKKTTMSFEHEYDFFYKDEEIDTDETFAALNIEDQGKIDLFSEKASAGFGFGHTDPSKGFDQGKWASTGANYRMAERGLNYISSCTNESCEAFE